MANDIQKVWSLHDYGASIDHAPLPDEPRDHRRRESVTRKSEFHRGDRVELSSVTDLHKAGACYGEVLSVGTKYVRVKLDKLPKPVKVRPNLLSLSYK